MKKLVLLGVLLALTVGAAEKDAACLLQRNPTGDAAVGPAGYVFAHMLPEDYGGMYYSISRDGLHWKLLNGGKRIIEAYRGHPDVVRGGDGKWHAIGTPRNRPKGVKQYGIHWTSTDLIRWEREDLAASVFDCSADGRSADGSLSAPKIFFDAATANYIISFHAYETKTDKMPQEKGEHRAHWRSMRTYYIVTKDWKTFAKPRPLFAFTGADAEMAQIDTVIRKFGNTYYAVIKDERWEDECPTGKRIRVAKSKGGALGPYANPMPPLCPDRREAPYPVLSPDGKAWVFMEDYNMGEGRYDLYEADTPEGPWHPAKGFVTPPARHGCVFRVDDATYRRLDERLGGGNQGGEDHPFSTLRLPATPERWAEQRDMLSRCRDGFDEIWFSACNFKSLEENAARAKWLADAARDVRAMGYKASLEFELTIGNEDYPNSERMPFKDWTGFTGPDGWEGIRCNCPRDPRFHAYFDAQLKDYCAWKPYAIWLDDDVRVENHGKNHDGCYCTRCVELFAKAEGRAWTRETLVAAMKDDSALAARWREHCFRGLAEFAGAFVRSVKAYAPETRIGFQYPWADEGQLLIVEAMAKAGGGKIEMRPGCCHYDDRDPYGLIGKTYRMQRQLRTLLKRPELYSRLCPEIETYPRTFTMRTPRSLAFEALTHLSLGLDSLTWYIAGGAEPCALYERTTMLAPRKNLWLYREYVRRNEGAESVGFDAPAYPLGQWSPNFDARKATSGIPYSFGPGRTLGTVLWDCAEFRALDDAALGKILAGPVIADRSAVGELVCRKLLDASALQLKTDELSDSSVSHAKTVATPQGGRLAVFPSLDPYSVSSQELLAYPKLADEVCGGRLPVVPETPVLDVFFPRVFADGSFASVVIVNTRIDRQEPLVLRLRKFRGDTALWFALNATEPVKLPVVRDAATGDARVTVPSLDAWSGGFLAPAAWRPKERWCGFNLLGMFCQTKMEQGDNRIFGYFPEDRFQWMQAWGFNFARLPLDYRFFVEKDDWMKPVESQLKKLDDAVRLGKRYGIHVEINFHRAPGYCCNEPKEPQSLFLHREPLVAFTNLWSVLAKRYRGIPNEELSFDLVNEPAPLAYYGATPSNYAVVARAALAAIRAVDPDRFVMSDGWRWGNEPVMALHPFDPASGESIHCYEPHVMTHHTIDNPNVKGPCPAWPPKGWTNGVEWLEKNYVKAWRPAIADGTPLFVGEFGCYQSVPHATYLAWLEDVLTVCDRYGWGWALWNLDGRFGIMDTERPGGQYEDFHGHRLERAALEVLRRHLRK